ncbi:MAG TPA: GNAT family N-acetyltransferase [Firmicutes bacterium]|nr:GNAT family N-acetyltransferase [Bacillota bacterium]
MFMNYQPVLLPKLAEIHASYTSPTKGMTAFPVEHWEMLFTHPDVDPSRDLFIAARIDIDGNNIPVGFAWLYNRPAEKRSFMRGPFISPSDPDCLEILEAMCAKSIERAKELEVDFIESRSLYNPWAEQYNRMGFVKMGDYERWRLFPLRGAIELARTPSELAVRNWSGNDDIPILMRLFTEAFSEHWDFVPPRRESFEELTRDRYFEKKLTLIAEYEGKPAGYIMGQSIPDPSTLSLRAAYLVSIGLGKEYRGRGLGKVLMSRWLRAVYDSGLRAAELDLDSLNTAAKRLYGSFGFMRQRTEGIWRFYLMDETKR